MKISIYTDTNYQNNWNADKYDTGVYYYILDVSDGRSFKGFFQIAK